MTSEDVQITALRRISSQAVCMREKNVGPSFYGNSTVQTQYIIVIGAFELATLSVSGIASPFPQAAGTGSSPLLP